MKKRPDAWRDLKRTKKCQVLILGGGVNGAAVLRDLAYQGVDCVLVDKNDFVAGASSQSSRMIHGGLRYLENREFKLVREAVLERNRLLRYAPHYVFPLKTSIPIDSWFAGLLKSPLVFLGLPVTPGGRGAFVVKMGLMFYDFITRKQRRTPTHFLRSKKKALEEIPGLRENIVCTANYWDAWVSQAERLCVNMVKEACTVKPETIALNYIDAEREDAGTVKLTDQTGGETALLEPDIVVNATGAWIDFTNAKLGAGTQFMGGTKGSHLVIDNKKLYDALGDRMVYYEHTDGRVCITFRFLDKVIMGSTDIKVENPDDADCEPSEVEYMITTLKGAFPKLEISPGDIVYQFCGVRPLPASNLDYTSRVSRSHHVGTSPPDKDRAFPIHSLIGGKWTTFGAFAREVTDALLEELGANRKKSIDEVCYTGAAGFPEREDEQKALVKKTAAEHELSEAYVGHLFSRYGMETETLAQAKSKDLAKPLKTLPGYSLGEIAWIVENECVEHLMDLVRRRSVIALLGDATGDVLTELAGVAGDLLGWDAGRRSREVADTLKEVRQKDS
jgi:glycerol-3-phosphate dehydrogenase